jgi:D-alanine transaminase
MPRIVYVNGEFVDEADARISVFDRGFLFADGVYEVTTILGGKMVDNAAHLDRLERSLDELEMPAPCSTNEIESIQRQLIQRNAVSEGVIYLQITRGAADRDFAYPKNPTPTLVMFTQHKDIIDSKVADRGISIITVPDLRWQRRDIKTVGLLWPAMVKQQAKVAGADDAWMVEDGMVTEGSSNNAFIVDQQGTLITRHLGNEILHGITRKSVLALSAATGIVVEERSFSVNEAIAASEAFITSASTFVYPVIEIDNHPVGDGRPGPVARQLRALYIKNALESAA